MPVLCDQVTQCLGSLATNLVSATSMNGVPSYEVNEVKELWIAHYHTWRQHSTCEPEHSHLFLPGTDWHKIFLNILQYKIGTKSNIRKMFYLLFQLSLLQLLTYLSLNCHYPFSISIMINWVGQQVTPKLNQSSSSGITCSCLLLLLLLIYLNFLLLYMPHVYKETRNWKIYIFSLLVGIKNTLTTVLVFCERQIKGNP